MESSQEKLPADVVSVSDFISFLNEKLEMCSARIIGEVSQCTVASSGHVYFSLKDKHDNSTLNCVMWRSAYSIYGVKLQDGMEVIVSGHPEIYAPRGNLSFIASSIELFGEGALKKAYDLLKKQLEREGLFASERKRELPEFPHEIGVISSREGAVIHDFVNNIGKRGFKIHFIHAQVEGQQSVPSLLEAIKTFCKMPLDALVIIRGGGSLESLQGFNNEKLVREIAKFPAPVIAGIGHHQDVPLASLVADAMVSTPTAAASLLGRSWDDLELRIERFERGIVDRFGSFLREMMMNFESRMANLPDRFETALSDTMQNLSLIEQTIRLNDPLRQLKLGYSIARFGTRIIRKRSDVAEGDELEIQVSDGVIKSKVGGSK